jgi:ComF family protein
MKIIDYLLDLLYPKRCFLCGRILRDFEKHCCVPCRDELDKLRAGEGRRDIKNIRLCVAPFIYKDSVRQSLHRYKFKSAAAYAAVYADFIAKSIDENRIFCDIISWVPLSKRRLRERGYDQAEILARELAKILEIECLPLLEKQRHTKAQSSLSGREARKANAAGAYRCIAPEKLKDKTLLLVDDIVTTGATLSECAGVLNRAGCKEIYAATVATREL